MIGVECRIATDDRNLLDDRLRDHQTVEWITMTVREGKCRDLGRVRSHDGEQEEPLLASVQKVLEWLLQGQLADAFASQVPVI